MLDGGRQREGHCKDSAEEGEGSRRREMHSGTDNKDRSTHSHSLSLSLTGMHAYTRTNLFEKFCCSKTAHHSEFVPVLKHKSIRKKKEAQQQTHAHTVFIANVPGTLRAVSSSSDAPEHNKSHAKKKQPKTHKCERRQINPANQMEHFLNAPNLSNVSIRQRARRLSICHN